MVLSLNTNQKERCFQRLGESLRPLMAGAETCYLDLGGIRTVRIVACDPDAMPMIRRQLAWSLTGPVAKPDATLVLWRESSCADYHYRVLGLDIADDGMGEDMMLLHRDGLQLTSFGRISYANSNVYLYDNQTFYYGVGDFSPEVWIREGHLFVQSLYRVSDTPSSHLVHGACIGWEGSGVLVCARGQRGKSTLAVTAMLNGFDYVSDDYLILEQTPSALLASPIYSIITLSPQMYSTLYDRLDRARFVCNNARKDKYVFDISGYEAALRRRYPVRLCLFPEIDLSAPKARIEPCSPAEKGRAITHIVHSTVQQMQAQGDTGAVRKLIGMLTGLPFYRMILSRDIFGNTACLQAFLLARQND